MLPADLTRNFTEVLQREEKRYGLETQTYIEKGKVLQKKEMKIKQNP